MVTTNEIVDLVLIVDQITGGDCQISGNEAKLILKELKLRQKMRKTKSKK